MADADLKFGLAAVGLVDPGRMMTHDGARAGDRILLTKPLGTGVIINGYRAGKLGAEALEPALVEMARLNAEASRLAVAAGVRAATDVTGFGLAGHALKVARRSGVRLRLRHAALEIHPVPRGGGEGVTTGSTKPGRWFVEASLDDRVGLAPPQRAILFDPQTSGGLLSSWAPERHSACSPPSSPRGIAPEVGEAVARSAGARDRLSQSASRRRRRARATSAAPAVPSR